MRGRDKKWVMDIEVGLHDDKLWLGFFAEDGSSGVVPLDKVLACVPEGSISHAAIVAWGNDRREQAVRERVELSKVS